MIVRAPVIVTMDGAPLRDGAVRIEGDRIHDVGRLSELGAFSGEGKIIELDGCVLLPGLINAHCHLDYTCLRGKIPRQKSFADWIRAINAEKGKLTEADYLRSIAAGICEAQRFGTTSVVNLEAFPELIARCQPEPLRVWWCAELIDVSAPEKSAAIIAAAMNCLAGNRGRFGLAPHAPYTASAALYRQCQQIAASQNLLLSTHLAESHEEMEMFRDGAGPLFEFLSSLGRDSSECGAVTPLEYFLRIIRDEKPGLADCVGYVTASTPKAFGAQNDKNGNLAPWIIAHLNELAEGDFDLLERLPEKFSIAHCPRSHAYFQHSPFAFERLREIGFNICLASDSLASSADLSLFGEMREFRKLHPRIGADEVTQMVTTNPAQALRRSDQLGKIAPGYLADMIALPLEGLADIHEQIIAFDGQVPWMMIGGEVL